MTLPCASLTVADSGTVAPATTDAVAGVMVTVVTTGVGGGDALTLTLAVPDFPELVAVIVAVPAPTPVTTPPELTIAMPGLFVDHTIT
jgi:hypothetical protein